MALARALPGGSRPITWRKHHLDESPSAEKLQEYGEEEEEQKKNNGSGAFFNKIRRIARNLKKGGQNTPPSPSSLKKIVQQK